MNATHPQISIIIPTYNRKSHLNQALKSVWEQTELNYEVIVIDDGSTDGTTEWLHQHHPQAQVIQLSANQGAARNVGIRQAKGRWIAFLDSDDQWLPDYLKVQKQALEQHPESVLAYCDYIRVFSPDEPGIQTSVQPRGCYALLLNWEHE